MSRVGFAFVGCGGIARHHLRALQSSKRDTEVTAVVDVDGRKAEEFRRLVQEQYRSHQSKCEVFTSLTDALQWGKFDAAVLMVPHDLHGTYAGQCLLAGKHVLLEKPLAHTVSACLKLIQVAERARATLMVGENSPFWPEVVKAKELLENGVIGAPYFAQANYWESIGSENMFLDQEESSSMGPTHWRFDPERVGGGVLMDGATHWVRPLQHWFGHVTEAIGLVGHPHQPCKGESLAHALLRCGDSAMPAVLHCHVNDVPMTTLPFFQIFGSKGEITINGSFDGGMSVRTCNQQEGQFFDSLGGYMASFFPQMENFLQAITDGNKEKNCTENPTQALREVLVAKAIYKSMSSKKWEQVNLENLLL